MASNGFPEDMNGRNKNLEKFVTQPGHHLHVDALLDSVTALVKDCDYNGSSRNKNIEKFLNRYSHIASNLEQLRLCTSDFDPIKIIGRGAFGQVQVVRMKETGQIYALKRMSKFAMMKKSEQACFWEERDIMAQTESEWIVKLYFAFQDTDFLYMIMEYCPGGDMVTLLTTHELSESDCQFYLAEIILSLDAIHQMGYLHRDVKPDNMLLDAKGHIKLADFGTCIKMNEKGLICSETPVGTPDYIAPEVLQSQGHPTEYGKECDWWSVGICLYEFYFDNTPFYADGMLETYKNIMNHKNKLSFPSDKSISKEAKNIISRFLSEGNTRLGRRGAAEIKEHAFFKTNAWTWDKIRQAQVPSLPNLCGDDDTSYFDDIPDGDVQDPEIFPSQSNFTGNNLPFVGFTYSRDKGLLSNINNTASRPTSASIANRPKREEYVSKIDYEQKVSNLETKCRRLQQDFDQEHLDRLELLNSNSELETQVKLKIMDVNSLQKKFDEQLTQNEKIKTKMEETVSMNNEQIVYELQHERDINETLNLAKFTLDQELQDLKSAEDVLRNQYLTAEAKLSTILEEQTALVAEINVHKTKIYDVNSEMKLLRRQKEVLTSERSDLSEKLLHIEANFAEHLTELSSMREDLAQQRVINKQLEEKCQQILEFQITAPNNNNNNNNNALTDVLQSASYLELKEIQTTQEQELSKYKVQIQAIKISLEHKENELYELKLKSDQYKEQIAQAKTSRLEVLTDLNKTVALNESLRTIEAGNTHRLEELTLLKNKLEVELQKTKKELSFKTSKEHELTEKLAVLQQENANIDRKFGDSLNSQLSRQELDENTDSFKNELDIIKNNYNEEMKARQDLEQKITFLERDSLQLELTYKESQSRFRTTSTELRTENRRLQEDIERWEEVSQNQQDRCEELSDHIEKLYEKITTCEDESEKDKATYTKLQDQLHSERLLKLQAVKKLEELTVNSPAYQLQPVRSKTQDKKLFYENRRLQKELNEEIERRQKIESKYEQEVGDIQSLLNEELEHRKQMQIMLKEREDDLRRLREQGLLAPYNGPNEIINPVMSNRETVMRAPLGVKSNLRRAQWTLVNVILCYAEKKLKLIYKDLENTDPISIHFDNICRVKNCQNYDFDSSRLPDRYIGVALVITYYKEMNEEAREKKIQTSDNDRTTDILGHNFVAITLARNFSCDVCSKSTRIFGLFSSAYECKRCNFRSHKEHLDPKEFAMSIPECSGWRDASQLYLLAEGEKQKQDWVSLIQAIIPSHCYISKPLKRSCTIPTSAHPQNSPYKPNDNAMSVKKQVVVNMNSSLNMITKKSLSDSNRH